MRNVFALQYTTAERIGAVLQLRWSDISGDVVTYRAETRKGGRKPNCKRLPKWVVDQLDEFRRPHRVLLFPECHGTSKIYKLYSRLFKRAGVDRPPGKSSHLLRSTFATLVHLGGGDATAALGHASSATTIRYYHDPRFSPTDDWRLLPLAVS